MKFLRFLPALFTAFLLLSCNFDDPFGNYDGTNLIADMDFDDRDLTADGATSFATWTWAWKENATNPYEYMTFAASTETGPDGGDAYLLELKNLYTEDGTFESVTAGDTPTGWSSGTGTAATVIASGTTGEIHGQTLSLAAYPQKYVYLNPVQTIIADLSEDKQDYHLSFISSGGTNYRFAATTTSDPLETPDGTLESTQNAATIGDTVFSGVTNTDTRRLLFGSSSEEIVAYLDELRFIRYGPIYALRLRLRRTDPSLPIIAGYYAFSVQVKKPTDRRFPSETGTEDYAAQEVTAILTQYDGTNSSEKLTGSIVPTSEWSTLTITGSNVNVINVGDDEVLLEIAIYPTDRTAPDAGAVLIADPKLVYYSAGY